MATQKKYAADEYTVEYWREQYELLARKFPKGRIRILAQNDRFFDSKQGVYDYQNIVAGRAGLEKTRRAVLALRKEEKKLFFTDRTSKPLHK